MRLREAAAVGWNGLLDVVYPPRCLVCESVQAAGALCLVCRGEIKPLAPPFCDRCGAPISPGRAVCPDCEAGPEPPFAWSQAWGQYDGVLRRAIHRLKYDGKTALAHPLGVLLAASLDEPPSPLLFPTDPQSGPLDFDVVVPVPLHPARLRQRGFNQAERVARIVAQQRGWRMDDRSLRRTRATRTQTDLNAAERARNVAEAFTARTPLAFQNQRVLLLDDVLTTSATVTECARVLQNAGASRVCIVALARGA